MSLIKAAEAECLLRPLAPGTPGAGTASPTPSTDPTLQLESRIAELEEELALLRKAVPDRIETAREEGLKAGRKEKDDKAAERLTLLGEGMNQALSSWNGQLASTGQLAILIAKGALGRLLGNPEWRSEFIVGAIERRIAEADKAGILSIRVSSADFSETEIAALVVTSGTKIEADPKLRPGECRIELEMGHELLGIESQWSRLALLLDELAEAAC